MPGMARNRTVLVACFSVFLCLVASGSAVTTHAQRVGRPVSRVAIPSPRSVLGFAPGDDRTIADWGQITDYFARLDKASDRVLIQTIGESTLKRRMIVAFISARENLLALNKYKELQHKISDPRMVASESERDR